MGQVVCHGNTQEVLAGVQARGSGSHSMDSTPFPRTVELTGAL
jgi:hypothetical protein